MRYSIVLLSGVIFSGCKLFGAIEEARELLEEPVTMQGLIYGIEPPVGLPSAIDTSGTILDLGARAQAWVQRTGTSGVQVVDGASVSVISDRRPLGVKLVQDGAGWFADGRAGLEYLVGDEVKLEVDYGERGSISMDLPAGPVVNIQQDHSAGIGIDIRITNAPNETPFDNGFVIVVDVLTAVADDGSDPIVFESEYDVEEPIDIDNLEIGIPGSVFAADRLYAVGVIGLVASTEDDLIGLNPLGSGMLVGQMIVKTVFTGDITL